jgi:CBS domain-containing protein
VRTLIEGRDNLQVALDNVVLETCNTSFQVHMQVDADEFPRFYNIAQLVAGPVVAAAANSPLLLQHRLWHETRIPSFEQAIDIRSAPNRMRDTWQRVSFGEGWVNDSVVELYQDQVARHRVTMMGDTGEPSREQLARGEPPALRALCIHNGSVYRWNRPCYGVTDGRPHLRIEHRPLPSGPTILDEVANAAFFLGLLVGIERHHGDVRTAFSFGDARSNFLAGARYGLNAMLHWEGGQTIPARTLIPETLVPLAHEGLAQMGVPAEERHRYLDVIAERARTGRNGALWTLDAFEALGDIRSKGARCQVLTQAIMRRQWTGTPVHEWTLPSSTEHGRWTDRYQRVAQVMSTDLFTVRPDDLVDVAASMMQWKRIRHVPVEDDTGRLVGLISYRSLLRLVAEGHAGTPVPVREIMHADPVTVSPTDSCLSAMRTMQDQGVACLPVVHEGRLVGIVSERDFLQVARALFEEELERGGKRVERRVVSRES